MNKKTSKARSVSADIEVRVKSASGTTYRALVEKLFKVTLSASERKPRRRSANDAIQRVEVIPPWLMDDEEQQPQTETRSDAEIEAALWQEVEEAREAERAEELLLWQ